MKQELMKEELTKTFEASIQKILGVADLMYSAGGQELKSFKEEALEGISLVLWDAAHELNEAHPSLCTQEEGAQ